MLFGDGGCVFERRRPVASPLHAELMRETNHTAPALVYFALTKASRDNFGARIPHEGIWHPSTSPSPVARDP